MLGGQAGGLAGSVVIHTGNENDLGAVLLGGLHLADGSAGGHADDGLDAQLGGGEGNALGVVAGGAGDNALGGFAGGQGTDLVVSAADLEGTGQLQVLSLDVQIVRDLGCGIQRRPAGNAPESGLSVLDHFQSQHDKDLPKKFCFSYLNNSPLVVHKSFVFFQVLVLLAETISISLVFHFLL